MNESTGNPLKTIGQQIQTPSYFNNHYVLFYIPRICLNTKRVLNTNCDSLLYQLG